MRRLRSILFWTHLTAGVAAGAVILIMSLTGAILALQPQLLNWLERDARVVVPAETRWSADAILAAAAERRQAMPAAASFESDPRAAVSVSFGRDGTLWVDPYSGRVLGEGATTARAFFQSVTEWHRWLARDGGRRPTARAITGASNAAFLLLAISGLYLWIPRSWKNVRAVAWFQRAGTGRAREFNWHNVVGLWCAPAIIVMAATGVVMSYPWANRLVYQLAGTPLPVQQARPAASAGDSGRRDAERNRAPQNSEARQAAAPPNLDRVIATASARMPTWRSLTMRFGGGSGGPVTLTLVDGAYWNPFARSTLTIDSRTSAAPRWEPYTAQTRGQRWRGWIRFAHTGELGGVGAQLIAGVACLGGVFLVYTGLSLAIRRLLGTRVLKRRAIGATAFVLPPRSVVESSQKGLTAR